MAAAAPPLPAQMLPREIINGTVALPHKPSATIHYSYVSSPANENVKVESQTAGGVGTGNIAVIFINGLASDKASWLPVMAGIVKQRHSVPEGYPQMLAYDRYGQGLTSDRDPHDIGKEVGRGHDCADAAHDLAEVIRAVIGKGHESALTSLRIILVGNSIGCAIARLYAAKYPVAGVLLLDSVLANHDFDFWPDPDSPNFRLDQIPLDVTIDVLRAQRARIASIFKPTVVNREGLDRTDLHKLLPYADEPKLGSGDKAPWITVIGHDFDTFAQENLKSFGTPLSLINDYVNPTWHAYNEGLAKLTDQKYSKGPFQAVNCGHFIQRDDPNLVVDETLDLVDKVRLEKSAIW